MKIKLVGDHKIVRTNTCGEIREILSGAEHPSLNLAVAVDIRPTRAHFHKTFDEVYFVLDGELTLQTFDPSNGKREEVRLKANELCCITKEVHHQITSSSERNRLCIISTPRWIPNDEYLSDVI